MLSTIAMVCGSNQWQTASEMLAVPKKPNHWPEGEANLSFATRDALLSSGLPAQLTVPVDFDVLSEVSAKSAHLVVLQPVCHATCKASVQDRQGAQQRLYGT